MDPEALLAGLALWGTGDFFAQKVPEVWRYLYGNAIGAAALALTLALWG